MLGLIIPVRICLPCRWHRKGSGASSHLGDNWGEEAEGVWKKGAWSRTYFRQKESLWHQGGDAMLACVEYSLEIWVKVPATVFLGLECPPHVSPRDLAGV